MVLRPGLRKSLLVLHVSCSVGMLGTVAAFLLLAVIGVARSDPDTLQATYLSMDMLARLLILPLVLVALLIGVIQSLLSNRGLFRQWWIVVKLVVSLIVPVVLRLQMPGIRLVATAAAAGLPLDGLSGQRMSFVIHAGGGFVTLLLPLILSVYKPRGLTRYGWRKQSEPGGKTGFLRTGCGVPGLDFQALNAARSLPLSDWSQ